MAYELIYTYTSQAEMTRLFSADGITLRLDDLEETTEQPSMLTEIIEEATEEINSYLEPFYEPDQLAASPYIRRIATYLGCRILSMRRGNPDLFEERVEEFRKFMLEVSVGRRRVPRIPLRQNFAPALSNYQINDNFYRNKVRVNRQTSTGKPSPNEDSNWPYITWPY